MANNTKSDPGQELLPWYLTGTLSEEERQAVEVYLRENPEGERQLAALQNLHAVVQDQPVSSPSPMIQSQVLDQVRGGKAPSRRRWKTWAMGVALGLLSLLLLWALIQPGIVLQWSVQNGGLSVFRVYRAAPGTEDFTLLKEVPATADMDEYTFVDTRLWPGQGYVYMVEGVNQAGEMALSQRVRGSARAALPMQLALLLTSLVLGYAVVVLSEYRQVRTWAKV